MENQATNRITMIAVVTGIVALLLGLCGGAVLGGFAGYTLGEQAAARSFEGAGSSLAPGPIIPRGGGSDQVQGVFVQEVIAGSPAEQAGLQVGDIITSVDNVRLDATHRLADVLAQHRPGDSIRLTYTRGGASRSVNARLASAPTSSQTAYLGIRYTQLNVTPASPAP